MTSLSKAQRGRPPPPQASKRAQGLRAGLLLMGAVASITGSLVAVKGTAAIPGGALTGASNDSVLRFYAVWWAAQGPAFWAAAQHPETNGRTIRALSALTFLGGLARLAAARTSGWPHPLFRALTALELTAPIVLIS